MGRNAGLAGAATDMVPPMDPSGGMRLLGHPPGLFLLFFVEMWERFSYYGMRALLVLYLMENAARDHKTSYGIVNPGRQWSEGEANTLYGWYTGLAYLFPVLGGIIADKFIGTHRSMVLGGLIIALGHIVLAVSGMGEWAHNEVGMSAFIGGLALIILGTGHFKPCVSTMVGQLYRQGDASRDGGFSIFYMGINLGAFLCAFVCGTLGQKVGWHWGFGSAAVGMIAGLIMYVFGRPQFLRGIGLAPEGRPNISALMFVINCALAAGVGYAFHLGFFGRISGAIEQLGKPENATLAQVLLGGLLAVVVVGAGWFVAAQRPGDRGPTASIFLFMMFNIFFWIGFEQAGSTMNVFAERSTDRTVFGYDVPATWFQSINAGLIFLLAPLFALLWASLGRRQLSPSQPAKIGLGLVLLGVGFLFMVMGAMRNNDGTLVSPWWLFMAYFVHTLGELCLSPTGLSYVTKAAPLRWVALLMGIWFISSFVGNLGAGLVASQVEAIEKGEVQLPWHFGGRADYFMIFVVSGIGMGVIVLVFTPLLKKMLRSKTD